MMKRFDSPFVLLNLVLVTGFSLALTLSHMGCTPNADNRSQSAQAKIESHLEEMELISQSLAGDLAIAVEDPPPTSQNTDLELAELHSAQTLLSRYVELAEQVLRLAETEDVQVVLPFDLEQAHLVSLAWLNKVEGEIAGL